MARASERGASPDESPIAERLAASEARLAEVEMLAGIGSMSWLVGEEHVDGSAGLRAIFGGELADPFTVADFVSHVHPDDLEELRAGFVRTTTEMEPLDIEFRISRGGEERWLRARGEIVEVRDGRAFRMAGTCQDITDSRLGEDRRRRAVDDLEAQQHILEAVARGEPLGTTLDTLCTAIEARYPGSRVTVLLADRAEGELRHVAAPSMEQQVLDALDGLPIAVGMGACGTAAATREVTVVEDCVTDPLTAPFRELAAAYELRSVWSMPLLNAAGEVLGTFAVYRREPHSPSRGERRTVVAAGRLAALAIERHQAELALTAAARLDPLTGLPNRTQFLDEVSRRLAVEGTSVAVMFLDVDRFKWINDSLGHPAGDRILVEIARRLRQVIRARDVVARFGGDEFTIVVNEAGPNDIAVIAGRVEDAFTEPFLLDGGEFFLTASVGIARNDHPGDAFALVRDADTAMYSAKEAGRSRHAMFDDQLRERAVARVSLEADLRRALDRHDITLHYQPIYSLPDRQLRGVEALARWPHPVEGMIPPDRFIPLAEETGLIVPLGLQVLDLALAQAAAWAAAGHPTPVSVNVSPIQLGDPEFPDHVARLLRQHRVDPTLLSLEITETGLMQQLDEVRLALRGVADLGCRVVIDDFGTGYSSIARLRDLPVVGVKIDRRFTEEVGSDPERAAVLAAISHLAGALGLHVVAEGIEDASSLDAAAAAGCDGAQGYHLARPGPAADAATWPRQEPVAPVG